MLFVDVGTKDSGSKHKIAIGASDSSIICINNENSSNNDKAISRNNHNHKNNGTRDVLPQLLQCPTISCTADTC